MRKTVVAHVKLASFAKLLQPTHICTEAHTVMLATDKSYMVHNC